MVPYWHLPGLGIIVYLLRQSANDFFSYYDSHRRSVNKLQNVEQLPPDEIKEVWILIMGNGDVWETSALPDKAGDQCQTDKMIITVRQKELQWLFCGGLKKSPSPKYHTS